ncbi:hypothetical protein BKA60DRAFT_597157 [Fusarium oxysporum]|nr:hypothetical protein BKA60DRAFT_597157 [Fusarium oxysporum]
MERSYKVPVRPRIGLAVNQSVLWVPRKTPVAAIAGGTVGGAVGVAILLGFGWWFHRRRAARKTLEKNAADENVLVESGARPTKPRTFHELAA